MPNFKIDDGLVLYDKDTFGMTEPSLKYFRDMLFHWGRNDRLVIFQVPTGDITCGFLIVNSNAKMFSWSGDGFRHDKKGEGGAGFKTARALLSIIGFDVLEIDLEENGGVVDGVEDESDIKKIVEAVLRAHPIKELCDEGYFKFLDEVRPRYFRG